MESKGKTTWKPEVCGDIFWMHDIFAGCWQGRRESKRKRKLPIRGRYSYYSMWIHSSPSIADSATKCTLARLGV